VAVRQWITARGTRLAGFDQIAVAAEYLRSPGMEIRPGSFRLRLRNALSIKGVILLVS
jgi:hypothetical protein